MRIPAVNNNSDTTFGYYKMPTKKTYRAMKGYYSLLNDKSAAVEYGALHNEAMARLHYRKFQKAEADLSQLADQYPESSSLRDKVKFFLKIAKLSNKMMFEKLASVHYYCRFS